uniref:Synaptotagmin X n=1 Tax=Cyprinus carpio carpio TaxID=630221 RepID=A0A8C1HBE2_CYPCA
MNPRTHASSNIQWINRKDMNVRTEDGISLCQRALQIVTELCLAGHVDREKCADIFPLESNIPDISVSLLAVVVGFCGLALLVVSLFVFWKLCWPIWRSKAFLSNADSCPPGVLPEAPLSPARPPVSRSVSPHPEAKAIGTVGKQPSQIQHEDENDKKRKVPEVKVNGRSSVKILEAAMKISQTSPDIPAEVQQALHNHLSKQAKIQRQTTEPTSSSRMFMQIARRNVQQTC